MSQKIIRYFPDTHMGLSHDGLGAIAKKVGLDTEKLSAGEYLLFVNKAQNKVKMIAPGNVIAYLRVKGKLDLRTISFLPTHFDGSQIKYDDALKRVLMKDLDFNV